MSELYYTTVQSVSYSSQRTSSRLSNKTVLSVVYGLYLEPFKKDLILGQCLCIQSTFSHFDLCFLDINLSFYDVVLY